MLFNSHCKIFFLNLSAAIRFFCLVFIFFLKNIRKKQLSDYEIIRLVLREQIVHNNLFLHYSAMFSVCYSISGNHR